MRSPGCSAIAHDAACQRRPQARLFPRSTAHVHSTLPFPFPDPDVLGPSSQMSTILITNDDGVESEGIHALAAAIRPLGRVVVCAPVGEASAIGHALTLARPLRLRE